MHMALHIAISSNKAEVRADEEAKAATHGGGEMGSTVCFLDLLPRRLRVALPTGTCVLRVGSIKCHVLEGRGVN